MQLYTVRFTTKHVVTKYDNRGKPVSSYTDHIQQTIHALPLTTAMQYKDCDNFTYEPYIAESKSSGKKFDGARQYGTYEHGVASKRSQKSHSASSSAVSAKRKVDSAKEAARRGDLSAAVSA